MSNPTFNPNHSMEPTRPDPTRFNNDRDRVDSIKSQTGVHRAQLKRNRPVFFFQLNGDRSEVISDSNPTGWQNFIGSGFSTGLALTR